MMALIEGYSRNGEVFDRVDKISFTFHSKTNDIIITQSRKYL